LITVRLRVEELLQDYCQFPPAHTHTHTQTAGCMDRLGETGVGEALMRGMKR